MPPEAMYAISGMDIDEISLVPSGDNPPGRIVLSKAAPTEDKKDCPVCDGTGKIMDGHRKCPNCKGTGDDPDYDQDDDSDEEPSATKKSVKKSFQGRRKLPIHKDALSAKERDALPDSAYAYIDPQGGRHFPVHDEKHARLAYQLAKTSPMGPKAMPKIKAACKKFGIEVSKYKPEPYSAKPGETVKCPSCGKMNEPDAKYCDQCGAKLAGLSKAAVMSPYNPDSPVFHKRPDFDSMSDRQKRMHITRDHGHSLSNEPTRPLAKVHALLHSAGKLINHSHNNWGSWDATHRGVRKDADDDSGTSGPDGDGDADDSSPFMFAGLTRNQKISHLKRSHQMGSTNFSGATHSKLSAMHSTAHRLRKIGRVHSHSDLSAWNMNKSDTSDNGKTTLRRNLNIRKGGNVELTPEQQAIVDGLPDDAQAMFGEVLKAANEEIAELEDAIDQNGTENEDDVSSALEKADPAIRRIIEKSQADAKAAQMQAQQAFEFAKAERERREDAEYLAQAQNFKNLAGSPQEKAEILKSAYKVDPETGDRIKNMMKAANAQLDGSDTLLTEIGKSSPNASGTVQEEITNRTRELMKSDPKLTKEQAEVMVFSSEPKLYDRFVKEGE